MEFGHGCSAALGLFLLHIHQGGIAVGEKLPCVNLGRGKCHREPEQVWCGGSSVLISSFI